MPPPLKLLPRLLLQWPLPRLPTPLHRQLPKLLPLKPLLPKLLHKLPHRPPLKLQLQKPRRPKLLLPKLPLPHKLRQMPLLPRLLPTPLHRPPHKPRLEAAQTFRAVEICPVVETRPAVVLAVVEMSPVVATPGVPAESTEAAQVSAEVVEFSVMEATPEAAMNSEVAAISEAVTTSEAAENPALAMVGICHQLPRMSRMLPRHHRKTVTTMDLLLSQLSTCPNGPTT